MNNKGRFPVIYSTRLLGPKTESRFGFALSTVGDLNKDGCEDIAVGAPYESSGVVYIFLGSRQGLHEKPSQVCIDVIKINYLYSELNKFL